MSLLKLSNPYKISYKTTTNRPFIPLSCTKISSVLPLWKRALHSSITVVYTSTRFRTTCSIPFRSVPFRSRFKVLASAWPTKQIPSGIFFGSDEFPRILILIQRPFRICNRPDTREHSLCAALKINLGITFSGRLSLLSRSKGKKMSSHVEFSVWCFLMENQPLNWELELNKSLW